MSVLEVVRFRIFKGTDFEEPFQLFQKSQIKTPINLTGCTVIARIKKFPTSATFETFGIVYVDRAQGQIKLTMDNLVTEDLTEGRNYFDIFVVYPDQSIKLETKGTCLVEETSYHGV